jgi:hypothetical protein
MNLENFKEIYKKTIVESSQDDSNLKEYIRSIVEEVISENAIDGLSDETGSAGEWFQLAGELILSDLEYSEDDFKKNVLPLYTKDWKRNGFDKKFADAIASNVKKFGDYGAYQVAKWYGTGNLGSRNHKMPIWWSAKNRNVKPQYIK